MDAYKDPPMKSIASSSSALVLESVPDLISSPNIPSTPTLLPSAIGVCSKYML